MRYALIDTTTNIVQNVTEWDGDTAKWQPPKDHIAVLLPDDSKVTRGYSYVAPSTFVFGQMPDQVLADTMRAKDAAVKDSVDTLRQWAADARGTTVTSGNAVATLQVIVNRLGTFFDRFADLVEVRK